MSESEPKGSLEWSALKWRSGRLGPAPRCSNPRCDCALGPHSERTVVTDNAGYIASFCAPCARRFFGIVVPLRKRGA